MNVIFQFFFFFFQAEDGIRDVAVTGVQTCALPISAWVKLRRTQYEHMFSALLSNSDIAQCSRHVSNLHRLGHSRGVSLGRYRWPVSNGRASHLLESSYVPVALPQPCPVPATIGFPLVSGTYSPPPVIPFHFPVPCKDFHFPPPVESSTCSPTTKSPSGTMNLQ